ncbi:CocE/NonD family hydrolase [Kytococcus sedentarius]|uniref:CocE/NonD family hydrolase n=1 Tax=Kytococcus sedentarius TaxID=1276 RepID=UPI0035BC4779
MSAATRRSLSIALAGSLLLVVPAATAAPSEGSRPAAPSQAGEAAAAAEGITHDENPQVPRGAAWSEAYFPSTLPSRNGDPVELHADVLRPAHLPEDAKTPVILSVGPYFSHLGQTDDEGHPVAGPSQRFVDFIDGADLMRRGYTVVLVDLRGFGASTGCLDWAGPGEQADVEAAVEWAASQPWSTGKVGMYGKSYDAMTGLIGNNNEPRGLEAVVAQEPVWDMHNYLYSNGVPRPNNVGTPNAYNHISGLPGHAGDTAKYKWNADYEKRNPECHALNSADGLISDPASEYWKDRDLASLAGGSDTPLFVTQGFIETNTKPEDMRKYLDNHRGEQRGWLGMWNHVRGNDRTEDGRLEMGREGWFTEVMSFYDEHLKGTEPQQEFPAYVIEDSNGQWRAQDTWPQVNTTRTVDLEDGSFVDDRAGVAAGAGASGAAEVSGGESFTVSTAGGAAHDIEDGPSLREARPQATSEVPQRKGPKGPKRDRITEDAYGYVTWSKPVKRETRVTGTPRVDFRARGEGAVAVQLFDVAPDGTAMRFDEQVVAVDGGRHQIALKDTEWTLAKGHQLAVRFGTIDADEYWSNEPTHEKVSVRDARLTLETQNTRRDVPTHGAVSPFLGRYVEAYTEQWDAKVPGTFTVKASQGKPKHP